MSETSDAALLVALRRQMTVAAARQVIAAGNLANVDTPGYKAKELDFQKTLDDTLSGTALRATDPRHLQAPGQPGPATVETPDLAARRDGNTVQLDRELLTMSRAASDFARAQTALAAKFRLIRYAINESR